MVQEYIGLLFGDEAVREDIERWRTQKFEFSEQFPFVLRQTHGGPCGVLAPLQAFLLERIVFSSTAGMIKSVEDLMKLEPLFLKSQLLNVMVEILTRASSGDQNCLAAAIGTLHAVPEITQLTALEFVSALVTARGAENVLSDMDDSSQPLIGRFGHCSQELLNLMLFGRAFSNVFDNTQALGDTGLVLRGVPPVSELADNELKVGLLSELEALRYVTVGSRLKHPSLPFWVLGSSNHYTTLFAFDQSVAAKSKDDVFNSIFDRFAFDDGLLMADQLQPLLHALEFRSSEDLAIAQSLGIDGIVLKDDFRKWIYPKMTGCTASKAEELVLVNGQFPEMVYRVTIRPRIGVTSTPPPAVSVDEHFVSILHTRWPTTSEVSLHQL